MRDGFCKVAGVVPSIVVSDPRGNAREIIRCMRAAAARGAKIIVFPELAVTGYTCNDLFLQDALLRAAEEALSEIRDATRPIDALVFVGCPIERRGKLYNCAAVLQRGKLLALIPKRFLPNYAEFYEPRQFTPGPETPFWIDCGGEKVLFGSRILITVDAVRDLLIGCELCEDAWVVNAPHLSHAMAGATVIVNLSASNETVGKDDYRKALVSSIAARTISEYIYVSTGDGESTQDIVFGGRILISENGALLAQRESFDNHYGEAKFAYADLDIQKINYERRRMSTYQTDAASAGGGVGSVSTGGALGATSLEGAAGSVIYELPSAGSGGYGIVRVHISEEETVLARYFDPHPFVPSDAEGRSRRCEEILNIQSRGLARRLAAIHCQCAVVGVSGGLDSTLALLVAARAFDLLGLSREGILAVTMPCFGTTERTHSNARTLAGALGATLLEIPIAAAVDRHFADIGQDPERRDVTYENGQARERTQVLMDLANQRGGIVIGTGDLSELALGWATYNGDHMSMYGVNVGVPKTLVTHLVRYQASLCKESEPALAACLEDVLATPVSPELLPPTGDGQISQRTEDLVGPYELHDFFLYHLLRCGERPRKIYRIALRAFEGVYDAQAILKWEKTFVRRFFAQQFKRSCLPDGPKVGSVSLSPRGDWRMPSDAQKEAWMQDLEEIEKGD